MPRRVKMPIEYASAVGSAAMDLYALGDMEADKAFAVLAHVNPEPFTWLRDRLNALVTHGKTCRKAKHIGAGYLHGEDHDGPYDVDGMLYCGRCHHYLEMRPAAQETER